MELQATVERQSGREDVVERTDTGNAAVKVISISHEVSKDTVPGYAVRHIGCWKNTWS